MKKLKVAVLFGGASSEHEVSRMSATSVLNNLDAEKYEVLPVGITKDGRWYLYSGPVEGLCSGAWERHSGNVPAAICPGSGLAGLVAFENGVCRSLPVDVVFPVLHGKNGEDGTIQGLLELAGLPYVGCGVLGSAVCMDKIIANRVMDATGIPRCEWDCMERWQRPELAVIARRAAEKLGWPIFVKPANAGSSVGISKARDMAELEAAVDLALQHDSRVVFERFVQGQEVECAVRGNDEVSGTHPGEILASAEFYTYDDKYISGTSRWPSGAACAGKAGRGAGPGRPRLPGAVLQGLGPRGLFCGARHTARAAQRGQHLAGLYQHQHVSQADAGGGRDVSRPAGQPDHAGAGKGGRRP